MSSAEFAEWMAYYGLEPFGPRREDYRAASILALTANVHRAETAKPFRPDDFLGLAEPPPPPSPEEAKEVVTRNARAFFDSLKNRTVH